jgi:hypothetical protein
MLRSLGGGPRTASAKVHRTQSPSGEGRSPERQGAEHTADEGGHPRRTVDPANRGETPSKALGGLTSGHMRPVFATGVADEKCIKSTQRSFRDGGMGETATSAHGRTVCQDF